MRRRRGAVCGTAAAAPRARPRKLHILRSAASGRTHTFRCSSSPNCNRCAGLQFGSSPSCGKRYGRKGRWRREIALTRLKKHFVSACHSLMIRPARNALRAAVESGFPSARYAVRVALFAPVEYLTYESRKAVLPARAALRIARNDFPCKGHPKQAQSISTTTPVWQIRICTAFCKSKNNFSTNQTPGKIQGRGPQPPAWSF